MADTHQKIRRFESEVLDKHHEGFAFYSYSDDTVIPYLLQTCGDTERHRDHLEKNGYDHTSLSFYLSNMLHGAGHCIRWAVNKAKGSAIDGAGIPYRKLHEMAADFIRWGTAYHTIAQEFVAWSREIKTAEIHESEKLIRFINPGGYEYSKIFDKQLFYAERMQRIYLSYPHDEMELEFKEWMKDIDFGNPPIANYVKWGRARNSKTFPLLNAKMQEILFPEIQGDFELGGYTLFQLRQFYALAFLNFHFIRWVEGLLDEGMIGENLSYGSNPLYLTQPEFENLVVRMTGFPATVAAAIIADLTFNPGSFHTSITLQPFIRSSSGLYYILPNLFSQFEPSRMILGAFNKGAKKAIYDMLINRIEKANLQTLAKVVAGLPICLFFLEKLIKYKGSQIRPDLILLDTAHKCTLVIDYKHFVGPITASEVDYKMRELAKGITQVSRYKNLLNCLPCIGTVNIEGFTVQGIIITHKLLPVPIPKGSSVPVIDLETFIMLVKRVVVEGDGLPALMGLVETIDKLPPKDDFVDFEADITVSDWTIRRSLHKIDDAGAMGN